MASRWGQQTEEICNGCIETDAEMVPEICTPSVYTAQKPVSLPRKGLSNPAKLPSFPPSVRQVCNKDVSAHVGNHPCQAIGLDTSGQICPSCSTQKVPEYYGHSHNAKTCQHVRLNEITEDDIPAHLKEGQFDILLLYAEKDRNDAMKFKRILECNVCVDGKPLRICVTDENLPWISSKFEHMDEAIARSTYMFLFMTKTFCNDVWAIMQKDEVLMTSIENPDKRWCVVPLFVDGKRNVGYTLPFGIKGLKGIDVSLLLGKRHIRDINVDELTSGDLDKFIIGNITALIKCRVDLRRKREREDESKLQVWKESENRRRNEMLRRQEEEEMVRRKEEMVRRKEEEAVRRKEEFERRNEEMVRSQEEIVRRKEEERQKQEMLMRRPVMPPGSVRTEAMIQTPEETTRPRLTEEQGRHSIIVNINTVQNLQIGSNNQIHMLHDDESEIFEDEDLPNPVVPPTSHRPVSQATPVDITVNYPRDATSTQAGQVNADCGSGDTTSSIDDTSLKQHPVGSSRDRTGSSQDMETEIRDDAAANHFGIDVRYSDADDDVDLKKPVGRSQTLCPADDPTLDDETDLLKPAQFRLTGPAEDWSAKNYTNDSTRFGEIEIDGPDNDDPDANLGTSLTVFCNKTYA